MSYLQADLIIPEWIDVTWEAQTMAFCVEPAGYLALPPAVSVDNREVVSPSRPDPTANTDDPAQVLRVYYTIDVSTLAATPTEAQWQKLLNAASEKPLSAYINAHALTSENFISNTRRARGTGLMKWTLGGFEISQAQKTAARAFLDTQAAVWGVSGTPKAEFKGVLQGELRQAATDLGYTTAQANKINVTVVNVTALDRTNAVADVKAYLVTNHAIWCAT